MPKFKEYNQGQAMLLPPDIRDIIPFDHICFVINDVAERLDISSIESTYSNNGSSAYNPRMFIKVIFYAYGQGIRSSRKIEKQINENLVYRYLSANSSPDHGTINLFRKNHLIHLAKLFAQIVVMCSNLKMIDPNDISMDGSIFKANASKNNAYNRDEIKKARKKIRKILEEAERIDEEEDKLFGKNNRGYDQMPEKLIDPETRKKEIKRLMDKMKKLAEADEKIKEKQNKVKNERAMIRNTSQNNNHNIVDQDANLMKLKNSKACKPAYNGQIAGSNQVIVGYDVTSEAVDEPSLKPMIEKTENNTKQKVKTIKADAGYWSGDNMKELEERKIDAYIPDRRKDFEEQKMKHNTLDKYHRNYFKYDEQNDEFICPEGKRLTLKVKSRNKHGDIQNQRYFCDHGNTCPKKEQCTKAKRKQICVDWKLENYKKIMRKKLNSKKGKQKYLERMSEVEPIFGNIIYNQNAGHFFCRGKPMVKIEFGLSCIAHNFIKITNWIKNQQNKQQFDALMKLGVVN